MYHANKQHNGANQHHQPLHGVVQHAGAKAAKGGIQRNADTENQQPGFIRNTRRGFQQARTADKLHGHRTNERNQQTQTRQPHQKTTLVAGKQHIVQRHRIVAARKNCELLAENTERKPDCRKLNHRQQYPPQAVFISSSRPADKRTGTDIGRGERHRQHNTAHRAAAEEILIKEGASAPFTHRINRDTEHHHQIGDQR